MKYTTKQSGNNEDQGTGAVRDSRDGKGRYDLISPIGTRRLAGVYERGAKFYGDRNWELGMRISRLLDSAKRHIDQYIEGHITEKKEMLEEDHLAAACWNLFAAMHMEETRPDLNDIRKYQKDDLSTGSFAKSKGKE